LFHNRNKDAWIRSGSATREGGIGKRLHTHMEQARCDRNNDDSWFYHSFPSKTSARSTSTAKEGYYEHLTAYIGVGFMAEYPLGCFTKSGGLLIFMEEEEKWISALIFRGKMGERKYMQMAAYLFELGYELALACRDNVSNSPGFEGCGLIFDKTGWKKD
jgi:hypothetical protein